MSQLMGRVNAPEIDFNFLYLLALIMNEIYIQLSLEEFRKIAGRCNMIQG